MTSKDEAETQAGHDRTCGVTRDRMEAASDVLEAMFAGCAVVLLVVPFSDGDAPMTAHYISNASREAATTMMRHCIANLALDDEEGE